MLLSILNDPVRAKTEEHAARIAATEIPARETIAPESVLEELAAIRAALTRIRFVISAHPDTLGVLRGGPRTYTLDTNDPEQLKAIIDDMQHRSHEPIAKLLPNTLVLGRNHATERLRAVFAKFDLDPAANFVDVDEERANLYHVALANQDLKRWMEPVANTEAAQLAGFLEAQAEEGRDKISVLLPESWASIGLWIRRTFAGLHVIVNEKPNVRHLGKDRVFLVIQRKGEKHPEESAIKAIRNADIPIAALTFTAAAPLSRCLRFLEEAAFTLRKPAENPRAALAAEIFEAGIADNAAWKQLHTSPESPKTLANAISYGVKTKAFARGEIAVFGNLHEAENGAKVFDSAARLLFRAPYKMPGTVCEAPSALLPDGGGTFTILVFPATQERFALAQYEPARHIADFLAAKKDLENNRRQARAILVKDLTADTLTVLDGFFSETASYLSHKS